jgi:hypothetical protein
MDFASITGVTGVGHLSYAVYGVGGYTSIHLLILSGCTYRLLPHKRIPQSYLLVRELASVHVPCTTCRRQVNAALCTTTITNTISTTVVVPVMSDMPADIILLMQAKCT